MLDGGRPGHVGAGDAGSLQGPAERAGICGRPLQVELRADVAVEDPVPPLQGRGLRGRHRPGGHGEAMVQDAYRGGRSVRLTEDNREGPLDVLTEALRKDGVRLLGAGPRHGQGGREKAG